MVSEKCYDAIIEMCERHRAKRLDEGLTETEPEWTDQEENQSVA